MDYYAGDMGRVSKFLNSSFDPTTHANLGQSVEFLNKAADKQAQHAVSMGALTGFSNAQERYAQHKAQQEINRIQGAAEKRAQQMSNIGSFIGAGASAYQGIQGLNKFNYGKTPMGAGGGVVDGVGTLGPNYGIPQKIGAGGGYVEGFGGTYGPNYGIM